MTIFEIAKVLNRNFDPADTYLDQVVKEIIKKWLGTEYASGFKLTDYGKIIARRIT